MDRDPNVYERETRVVDRDTGSSNFLAFLIGGLVIAVGLLAFLFYDGGTSRRDVSTTGSTTMSSPANPAKTIPAAPSTPRAPAAAPTAPAAPQ